MFRWIQRVTSHHWVQNKRTKALHHVQNPDERVKTGSKQKILLSRITSRGVGCLAIIRYFTITCLAIRYFTQIIINNITRIYLQYP